ncbi:MAG: PASTA domain-containing protein [Bacteroidota bacterium]
MKKVLTHIWNFIKERKKFFLNLAGAMLLVFAIFFVIYRYLDSYTKHGETITVPDLRGMTTDKVADFLQDKHLKYVIIDSIFVFKKARGSVLEQDPDPNAKVKENRTIYLTINAKVPPQVKFPQLEDYSYPYVVAYLETYGLKIGQLTYIPDLAKNRVLGAKYRGRDLKPGDKIAKGSEINLLLGDGLGNTKVAVPSLIGLPLDEALFVLKASSLNKGVIVSDAPINDTASFRVYKQKPEPTSEERISQGESVDIFVTQNLSKIPK